MRQHLIVVRDRFSLDAHAEPAGELDIGELPQTAEQTFGTTTREHHAIAIGDPHQRALDQRQL